MIELNKYNIGADEYGTINLFKEEYGEEVCLGDVSEDGSFSKSWWMKEDEQIEQTVKNILIEQYFNERVAHVDREQADWPERYLNFMQIEGIKRDLYGDYEKISNDPDDSSDAKGRYLGKNGFSLNGIYSKVVDAVVEKCVFNQGKKMYHWESIKREDDLNDHIENVHLSGEYVWQWLDQKALSQNYMVFKSFVDKNTFVAEMYCSNKKQLERQLSAIEKIEAEYLIFPHKDDGEKFRVIASAKQKVGDLIDLSSLNEQVDELVTLALISNKNWTEEKIVDFKNKIKSINANKIFDCHSYDEDPVLSRVLMQYPLDFQMHLYAKGLS
jgi:hypothetical protein